ncbi:uncharacterized protein MONOS_5276 [Monocercomonoides exilis]|uniref:uncharacterized protein n=1 Tax=Monocercomonoides exilis TaxID=2049356 RepID=UPI00355A26C7|nr:hypothetical protein MONOS_5276 [Monocercomonoides exilis]|eukprot:MONOS_5276.1-p1 / transcript=MONOS_5276.1 / gene=MONOS_5276 / organism=Monocercomonoides_exilis_PA203 / gene_product=unspecified product / transcript_product=unspecified product / location=Mono_scaffold00151:101952-102971(-) / protein_length=248 / sequence_SO=supercontig / SO=protein_coding / is_pseudo=false
MWPRGKGKNVYYLKWNEERREKMNGAGSAYTEEAKEDSEDEDNDDSDDSFVSDEEDYFDISRSADTSNADETDKTIEREEDSYTRPALRFPHKQPKIAALGRSTQTCLRTAAANGFATACLLASLPSQTGYANINSNGGGCNDGRGDDFGIIILFGRKGRLKTGLETLFVRSMQKIRQKEGAALLHSLGKALYHFFDHLKLPQILKPITIPSSHAGATGGILANDANQFLNLLCVARGCSTWEEKML